jgi:MFS-type transporter involved in bile tolerance (Atg22 family)
LTSYESVDDAHAKEVYVYLSYVSIAVTITFCLILGKLADKLSPKILVPLGFTLRGISLLCLQFVKVPDSY